MQTSIRSLHIIALTLYFALYSLHSSAQLYKEPQPQPANWSEPYQPFCMAGNLYYVGTSDLASYLITTPQGHILINTGTAASADMIQANVEQLGFSFSDIKILLATHAHYDHVGAMAEIKDRTHAQMMIAVKDAQVLGDGGNSDYAMGGDGGSFRPLSADRLLRDGDTIMLGGMIIQDLYHPGHTKGASSFLFTVKDDQRSYRVYIANMPTIIVDDLMVATEKYATIAQDYAYTISAMKSVDFDIWAASHASQFDLHKKRKENDGYHPELFADKDNYMQKLQKLEDDYYNKLKK